MTISATLLTIEEFANHADLLIFEVIVGGQSFELAEWLEDGKCERIDSHIETNQADTAAAVLELAGDVDLFDVLDAAIESSELDV